MIWKKHSDAVTNLLIRNAKIPSEKACDATLGKPNRSFVAFSDNILTLLIRTFKMLTPNHSYSFFNVNFIQIELNPK